MITEHDLQEAIAECEGQKNPNASTCIKLAAFYTIRNNMFPKTSEPLLPHSYSFMADPDADVEAEPVMINSDTDFARAANKLTQDTAWNIMDELMSTLAVLNPRLYASTMRKIETAE